MTGEILQSNWAGWRLLILKWVLCAAFLSEMLMAPKLWIADRPFPTVPVYPWIPDLPSALTIGLSSVLVLSLFWVALVPRPGWFCLAPVVIGYLLVAFDLNRLQPWFYQYTSMFIALALVDWDDIESRRSRAAWAGCAVVVVGIYFWSGLQKINASFAHEVFPWLMHPLGVRLDPLWPVAPVVETGIGLLLLFPRTRRWGIVGVVLMHGFLLYALGPLGQNYDSIVWPWNFWAIVLAFVLFWKSSDAASFAWGHPVGKAIVVLFGVMPALSFVNCWDGFLSASFYSGKLRNGWIYLTPEGARRLPSEYKKGNTGFVQDSPDRYRLDILAWSMSRLNAPPYAETRNFIGVVRALEKAGVPKKELLLMVRDRAALFSGEDTYSPVPVH